MDLETARDIYAAIRDSRWDALRDDVVELVVRYARIRVDWLLADRERRAAMDADRTRCHDALIAACDILARNMDRAGEDVEWRKQLADSRQRIGDFACCLHCVLGISAR